MMPPGGLKVMRETQTVVVGLRDDDKSQNDSSCRFEVLDMFEILQSILLCVVLRRISDRCEIRLMSDLYTCSMQLMQL